MFNFTAPVFDIVVYLLLLIAAISGYIRGFIKQAIGLLGILAGVYLAKLISENIDTWLSNTIDLHAKGLQIGLFIALFIALSIGAIWLSKLLTTLISFAMLSWLNHLLGVCLGVLQILIICCVVYYISLQLEINLFDHIPDLASSRTFPLIKKSLQYVLPFL